MKGQVIAILTEEWEKYSGEGAGKLDHARRVEHLFDCLAPYMRIDFPKDRVKTMLSALQSPDDFGHTLEQILTQLEQIWEGERRSGRDRRSESVRHIELESGKFIWHDVDQTRCGFEHRTGEERRDKR
ncbi:MAG: hypothetical protein JSU77_01990 [Fidelibacterota bacterium]|nr:MAG: hypothetical protein JSU77_01990 [Candidatus Neomarinimicrobiota bacterium]